MQQALFKETTPIHFRSQATRTLPGHGAGVLEQAVNDDEYQGGDSPLRTALAVLANVVGGALLLSGMVLLPHLLAGLLG